MKTKKKIDQYHNIVLQCHIVMSQSVVTENTASEVGILKNLVVTCILILHPKYILLVVNILISQCFGSFLVFFC